MNYSIHFIYQNPEFNQDHADEFHDGQESEDNIRDIWEDEIEVQGEVVEFKILHKQTFQLQGVQNDEEFSVPLDNMTLFKFTLADESHTVLAASNKLIKNIDIKDLTDFSKVVYVYLKGKEEPVSPFAGLYIRKADFPMI